MSPNEAYFNQTIKISEPFHSMLFFNNDQEIYMDLLSILISVIPDDPIKNGSVI